MDKAFWNGKRVLVTGGSGFVGRWLCRALRTADVDLRILDLAPPRNFEEQYQFHQADLRNLAATSKMLEDVAPNAIVHLAGQPGVASSHDDPIGAYEANTLATMNLLEACRRRGGIDTIVAISSNHVYGDQEKQPSAEDAALNGRGMYAVSKLCGDVLAQTYGKTYGVPVGVARMTNSYGGDDHHTAHIITGTILAALRGEPLIIKNSGRDRKGYLYIKDTVQGLLAVGEYTAKPSNPRGEAFNLAPDEAISVRDLVRAISDATGARQDPVIQQPDAHFENEHLDNSKARRLLGWSPRYSLREALAETVDWYRQRLKAG